MPLIYTTRRRVSSPASKPRFPYPIRWRPKHRGTYLIIAGQGSAS